MCEKAREGVRRVCVRVCRGGQRGGGRVGRESREAFCEEGRAGEREGV